MKIPGSSLPIVMVALVLVLFADRTQAQFLFNNIIATNNTIIGTNLTAGATFTVGTQPILVTALGVYDDQMNGLAQSYSVGIWSGGGLLTSATVPAGSGTTLWGEFRYVAIAPVVLSANATYRIGANLGFNNAFPFDLLGHDGSATLDPAFSFADAKLRSEYNTGFTEPTISHSYNLWAANLQYTAVPEPNVATLLGSGIVALARWSRCRCSQRASKTIKIK